MVKRLLVLVFVLATGLIQAQNQKIAHCNSSDILSKLPAVDTAKAKLKRAQDLFTSQYESLVSDYETKLRYWQEHEKELPQTVANDKKLELGQLEIRIRKFQSDAAAELDSLQKKLLEPITNQIKAVIKEVAVERGYDYVLDTSTGIVLYFLDGDDINAYVLKKMGVK